MELWEYNTYLSSYENKQKSDISNAILIGYYAAYYTNGGKKAKSPNELIKQMYVKVKKQSFEEGLKEIEKIRALEEA
ncbi:MAG: hypothetical protein FWC02_01645 [Firmicutes bacterium]|nr:hypothetical protein [Bacillota bacterium]